MLKSKSIGILTAVAIALTSSFAAPAMAKNNKDRLAIAVGALGLIYLLHEADKKKDRRKKDRRVHDHRHAPKHCLRQKWTNHGWKTFYGRKCLRKNGIDPNQRGLHHH